MKSINYCKIMLCMLLVLLGSCSRGKDEFKNITAPLLAGETALSFLDLPKEQVLEANEIAQNALQAQNSSETPSTTLMSDQELILEAHNTSQNTPALDSTPAAQESNATTLQQTSANFSSGHTIIKEWGELRFSQQNFDAKKRDLDIIASISTRAHKAPVAQIFLPLDTKIGTLHDTKNDSAVENKIYSLTLNFINSMKKGDIDKKLNLFIVKSEIPVISRQISRSVQYAPEINDIRVGKITIVSTDSRSCSVRIIRKTSTIDARAELLFYFINTNNQWLINAIEGDFNELLQAYKNPGLFTPLGTTGVTQGF